jgi:hypothetical protein
VDDGSRKLEVEEWFLTPIDAITVFRGLRGANITFSADLLNEREG